MTWYNVKFDLALLVLVVLLVLAGIVLVAAQRRSDFDLGNMLRDDTLKESALRLGVLVSLAVSSWVVIYDTLDGITDPQVFGMYCITWSGALVFVKAADKWNGALPWAK